MPVTSPPAQSRFHGGTMRAPPRDKNQATPTAKAAQAVRRRARTRLDNTRLRLAHQLDGPGRLDEGKPEHGLDRLWPRHLQAVAHHQRGDDQLELVERQGRAHAATGAAAEGEELEGRVLA